MIPQLPQWAELRLVMPEIVLALGMCAVLTAPLIRRGDVLLQSMVAFVTLVLALVSTLASLPHADQFVFSNMLAIDQFSQFFKILLLIFTVMVLLQWLLVGRRHTAAGDTPDFLCLLLGAAFGMSLMASANNLLMILIAMEAASLPSFALAGFRKASRLGSEGSLKYVVFGAASSATMVYGMSLIYGACGGLGLSDVAANAAGHLTPLLAVGLVALFVGIAFKLSAVPMHFWCPDVFQGAPIEVTTFLSVASKGAAMILLVRVLSAFAAESVDPSPFVGLATGIGILGAITATWGNLVALHQTNIKRLLAYSSIAHAGYMIMAVSVIAMATPANDSAATAAAAVLFYLMVYLFMNTGAFTVAALIARHTGSDDIRDYTGLIRRSPALALFLFLFLLSLFGMPGLGGFLGKIYLMEAMLGAGAGGFALIAVLLLNTLISLYYYVRPVYFMMLREDTENRLSFRMGLPAAVLLTLCLAALIWTGLDLGASNLTRDYATLNRPVRSLSQSAASALAQKSAAQPAVTP